MTLRNLKRKNIKIQWTGEKKQKEGRKEKMVIYSQNIGGNMGETVVKLGIRFEKLNKGQISLSGGISSSDWNGIGLGSHGPTKYDH